MKTSGNLKHVLIRILKVAGWIIASFILLLVALVVAIRIPAVQNRITQEAIQFLEKRIKTDVRLDYISISFPKKIVLTGLYLEDQKKDTLLYAGMLAIDTDLWGLTQRRIQLNDIELDKLTAYINRSPQDSAFNFDYIIDAFSDTTTVVEDTTAVPWEFSIGDIQLLHSHVAFRDPVGGNDFEFKAGEFAVETDEFDLTRSVIRVDEILLSDVEVSLIQSKVPIPEQAQDSIDTADEPSPYDLGFSTINLKNIKVRYAHEVLGQMLRVTLDEAVVDADNIDLKNQVIEINKISLPNAAVFYHQLKVENTSRQDHPSTLRKGKDPAPTKPWSIALADLEITNSIIQYYDFNKSMLPEGVDFNHLWISNLTTSASNLAWDGTNAHGVMERMSFSDRSGFAVTEFKSSLRLDSRSLQLDDFIFSTPWSHLAMDLRVRGDSISTLGSTYQDAEVDINISPSSIALKDVSYFSSTLSENLPVKLPEGERIAFSTSCTGTIKDLTIRELRVQALSGTTLQLEATVQGLPDVKNAMMHINLKKLYTTSKDLKSVVPDSLLPKSIRLPRWLNLAANFKGTLIKPEVKAALTSEYGAVHVTAKLNLDSTVTKENYAGEVKVDQFNLGKLLLQEKTIGVLDLQASLAGSGLTLDNLDALIDLKVNDFDYNGYRYQNFNLEGSIRKYFFSGEADLHDENLDFVLKGDLDYNGDIPHYKLNFDLKNADFAKLKLTVRPLKARLKLGVDLETSDFTSINGNLDIRNVAVYNGESLYMVDSLLFVSLDQEGRSELSIRSDIVSGDFKGTINILSLPDAVRRHFNNYFYLRDSTYDKPVAPQNFEFKLILKNTDLLTEVLFPDLEPFIPGEIAGEFNSVEKDLDIRFDIAEMKYAGVSVDSIRLRMNSDPEKLTYNLGIRNIRMDTLKISALRFTGNVADDSVRTRLVIEDSREKEKYDIAGVVYSFKDAFQFRLVPNGIRLNYENWRAPSDNYLTTGKLGLLPHHFEISRNQEKLSLVRANDSDSTIAIVFESFDLENLASLVEGTTPVDGDVNGDLNISVAETGAFNSNLAVRNLFVMEQGWGDLAVALGRTATGPFNFDVRLEGENVMLKTAGYITSKEEDPEIHMETEVTHLNLAVIEPLSFGQLKNVTGQLTGDIKVDGKTTQPDINGNIMFKDANFIVRKVNNQFVLNDETLTIKNGSLAFSKFEVRDGKNNVAEVNGTIQNNDFRNFDLNLSLHADNFQILNSTYRDNELFFGKVGVNTRITVTGNSNLPRVNVVASLTDDSEFTYVVPQSEKGVLEQEGIVVFVDRDAKNDPFLAGINPVDTAKADFAGLELTANIELTDEATFNIVIDQVTGDKLSVRGNSTLTLAIDPTGNIDLAGRYDVSEGTYDMSFYKLVKRKFDIEKGGSITWSGDPLNAMLDLRAIYEVDASPIELMSVENEPGTEAYKQRLPFLVYLQIRGELLTPEISFKLDMEERERNVMGGTVYAKVQDINTRESELNKQVFSLLVLNRFMSDNPFNTQGSGDVEAAARRSVSKLLTEQLNRLSENVKGVELTVDVRSYEDYSTGTGQGQTELQLGVSKSLLDDRLVVKVSGSVDVESETSQQTTFTDYIGDLALEYKLTEDGRFRVTGFRNSNYDMIDGELIETGAGLIYIKDYNTLKELFKGNPKDN
jgi:translocation and assembly module TamB